jgi:hypothetical protein
MILPWHYDYNTAKLTLKISDNLSYECLNGGVDGFTKTLNGVTTTIGIDDWEFGEKAWISRNYGSQFGAWQKETGKFSTVDGIAQIEHQDGTDEEGSRIDHLCRPAKLMLGYDMTSIYEFDYEVFETPDQGKTIYFRPSIKGTDTNYPDQNKDYGEVPQPCMMQPKITGRQLSSYDALLAAGEKNPNVDIDAIVAKCRAGQWDAPKFSELQKLYTYRT